MQPTKHTTGQPTARRADQRDDDGHATFRAAVGVWAKIGFLSFGGPAGQIALMHRVLVEEREWLDEREFLAALNFCMLLPGPEAMQLASYAGWKLFGWRGAVAAGVLFVLPGALVVLTLSILYALYGHLTAVAALFFGIKAAVLAIVVEALLRVARRALTYNYEWWIAAAAFIGLYFFLVPFPVVIAVAGMIGFFAVRHAAIAPAGPITRVHWFATVRTIALWLALWLIPVGALVLLFGRNHVYSEVALFFSKLAVVTFGGAYAVLSYMAQQVVETYHWLMPAHMIDGLGLAETTPGPLILVTEFVGFLAGYQHGGGVRGGLFAAAITLWVTFVPCLLWIIAGAPYIERLRANPRLSGALAAITAAVVGVILNLSLWFALHVSFRSVKRIDMLGMHPYIPQINSIDVASVVLSIIAAVVLFRFHFGLLKTLALSVILGIAYQLL